MPWSVIGCFLLVFCLLLVLAGQLCFYAANGLLSPFNLWLESGIRGSKHTSSHYLIIILSQRSKGVFLPSVWKNSCSAFSCIATTITRLKNYTQIHSGAAEFQIFPYFIAVGNHDDQPIFSSHKSVLSQQQFRASLVNSNPSVSLAKHWLEMTLQSPERLTVSL